MSAKHFILGLCLLAGAESARAQTTCGDGVNQLQAYIVQVNQVANYEYNQGIAMRCMGNYQCGSYLLMQLQQWYAYQTNLVNGWYMQLATQCTSQRPSPIDTGGVEDPIDEGKVEELEVDDEDKTVVLRIPDNPRGFRPRGQ